jgi:anti-sigma factor RsiW
MRHPDERKIALYACGDAGWMERVSVGSHIARCAACQEQVESYRRDQELLRRDAAQLPAGLEWNRLAAEMTANIRVGLEAGECVPAPPAVKQRRPLVWRPVLAGAGLALVLISGFYLNVPAEQRASLLRSAERIWMNPAPAEDVVSLTATRNGIEVRENGSALTMMNPGATPTVVVMNTRGSLRARYVDSDTGQVTITNVYAQ